MLDRLSVTVVFAFRDDAVVEMPPALIPVSCEPSPKYVTIPDPTGPTVPPVPTLIPDLMVTTPTESTLVTSSYVKVPPIEIFSTLNVSVVEL